MNTATLNPESAWQPLNLKAILIRLGVTRADLARHVTQANGRAMSPTAISQLCNHGYMPRDTPEADIKRQVLAALHKFGATQMESDTAFDVAASGENLRARHPQGIHRGKTTSEGYQPPAERPIYEFDPMEVEMLSPQAKKHFRFFRDPFLQDVTDPIDVFMSESHAYVLEAMMQTALVGGITAVIGESGSGKTTLRKLFQYRITNERSNIRIVFPQVLDKTRLTAGSICQAIMGDLAPNTRTRQSLEAQARQVKEVLIASADAGYKHVLVIEEAHDLSITTLKFLKRFHEIEALDGFGKVLSIVLIAQPEIRTNLDIARHPEAREFINRCEVATLEPLHKQLADYIKHKLRRANVNPDSVFADDAFEAIAERWTRIEAVSRRVSSNVYPLVVNNTVTRAMNEAARLGVPLVTAELIKAI